MIWHQSLTLRWCRTVGIPKGTVSCVPGRGRVGDLFCMCLISISSLTMARVGIDGGEGAAAVLGAGGGFGLLRAGFSRLISRYDAATSASLGKIWPFCRLQRTPEIDTSVGEQLVRPKNEVYPQCFLSIVQFGETHTSAMDLRGGCQSF